ncbi:MAG: TetR/AcrR family transcriptional regulator [Pseudomonadota bacterium]
MSRTSRPSDSTPPPDQRAVDGRRRRGHDNRERIVKAMIDIVQSGEVAPSAEQVALKADVGLRTVFRHFEDMDSLYREIGALIGDRVRAILGPPLTGEGWEARLIETLARRVRAFETIAPFKRSADAFRHRSRYLGSDYAELLVDLRNRLIAILPPEIASDPHRLEALDLLLSYEAWSRLRREQGLAPPRALAVLEDAVRRTISREPPPA